ncbi:hypothetical protein [Aeromonas caviae]|uniref:hypothetical protein n=1 Tax=Aeromonas caviae TaxID=648 RepID=UPI002B24F892|nr:hypothetical protein [Aeromonas caviae]MEA9429199.1 hypothetical protein [Aeromonas caviae]MEA9433782.1 hypothetical protein [Aeromonas caviae]
MQHDLEQTTHLVTQLQQAHRLAAGFYQRILPLFDQLASQALDADFWFWEPSENGRPCRSGTRPSSSWAWDYLPLFASDHGYRDWDSDTAEKGDVTLVFRLYTDHDFRRTSSLRAGVKGQPDPLQLNGQAIVEVSLFRCLENSDKNFDELWRPVPWPLHQPDWKQSEECALLAVCSNHVPLAQLLADPDSVARWIKEMNHR